ncbi:MAG: hypothetical protein WD490_06095, partial [Opitutales bacterium]
MKPLNPWEFCLSVDGRQGAWWLDARRLATENAWAWRALPFASRCWRVYGPFPKGGVLGPGGWPLGECALVKELPDALEVNDRMLSGIDAEEDARGILDFAKIFGGGGSGLAAVAVIDLDLDRDGEVVLHAGADWWMEWWVDGRPLSHTFPQGNHHAVGSVAHSYSMNLPAGWHRLGVRVVAGSTGWALCAETTFRADSCVPEDLTLHARFCFTHATKQSVQSLTLKGGGDIPPALNGHVPVREFPEMRYREWVGLPPEWLRRGKNELTRNWSGGPDVSAVLHSKVLRKFQRIQHGPDSALPTALVMWSKAEIQLRSEPVLAWTGENRLALRCRSTGRIALHLELEGKEMQASPEGTLHAFDLSALPVGEGIAMALRSGSGRIVWEGRVSLPNVRRGFTLGVLGDPSPDPERFAKVVEAMVAAEASRDRGTEVSEDRGRMPRVRVEVPHPAAEVSEDRG